MGNTRAACVLSCLLSACAVDDAPPVDDVEISNERAVNPRLRAMPELPPTAAELLAAVTSCDEIIAGPFATDANKAGTIDVCARPGIVHWVADMDIDCDGKESPQCNTSTDPYFQDSTSASDSQGDPLDSASLPFVVLPLRSTTKWDYRTAGLALGSVFAVVYGDRVEYGVVGDHGPAAIIGEASYAMAASLGIDPHPSTGGASAGVTYIGFTGTDAIVDPIEDHDIATAIGIERALLLIER